MGHFSVTRPTRRRARHFVPTIKAAVQSARTAPGVDRGRAVAAQPVARTDDRQCVSRAVHASLWSDYKSGDTVGHGRARSARTTSPSRARPCATRVRRHGRTGYHKHRVTTTQRNIPLDLRGDRKLFLYFFISLNNPARKH